MAWLVDDSLRFQQLSLLSPLFQPAASRVWERVREEGLPFRVWETLRDHRRQSAYYSQGRDAWNKVVHPGDVVTKAPPGESAHEWGMAMDLVLDIEGVNPWSGLKHKRAQFEPYWRAYADIAKDEGLITGFHSWGWDFPHIQLPMWTQHRPAGWRTLVEYRLETTEGD